MNRKSWFAASMVVLAMGIGAAHASTTTPLINRDEFTVGQGDALVDFGLVPNIFRGDLKSETVMFNLGGNYFLTDILAPGVSFEWWHVGGNNTVKFLPNLRAYWPLNRRIMPYAMVGLGWAHAGGLDMIDFALAPGIDFMLSNNVAIGMQLRYDLMAGNGTVHQISFPVQFTLYFDI